MRINIKNMNKTLIIVIICVGLLVVAGIGYAIWSSYNPSQVATQTPTPTSTSDTNPTPTPNPQPSLPTVKTDPTFAPYISTVVVKGTVNPNGALTTYWFEYGTTSGLGTKTTTYLIGSGYTTLYTPAYVTGLLSNTNYYFRLSAQNSLGTVNGTTYSFKTSTTPPPSGTVPTANTVAATDITRNAANLQGKINPNGDTTTYWFEYGTTSGLGAVSAYKTTDNTNLSLNVSALIPSLQPLTKYYFRLNAQNQFGTVNGQILNFVTDGPAASSIPTVNTNSATAITSDSAKLNAKVNPNGVATTYWFEYSDNSLLSLVSNTLEQSLSNNFSITNVSTDISNLNNDTKYYVRVVAKNQHGTVRGDVLSFTTKK